MLELAVLGFLQDAPMHGYELRKRLHGTLGAFRTFSCGTLYPTLRRMRRAGLIDEIEEDSGERSWGRRSRRVYRITTAGEQRFATLVDDSGPGACADDAFGVHVAFFSRTPVETRLRILEGRRRRVEERRDGLRAVLSERQLDRYTLELHKLGLDHSEQEVRWLNSIIEHERAEQAATGGHRTGSQQSQGHDR
ncbi:PadR family transcriptional regulator [Parasphingorhabdus pacifica]